MVMAKGVKGAGDGVGRESKPNWQNVPDNVFFSFVILVLNVFYREGPIVQLFILRVTKFF